VAVLVDRVAKLAGHLETMLTQRRGRVRLIARLSVVDVNRLFSIVIESDRGWKSTKVALLPVEGEIFFLTFPFIDQALAM